MIPATALQMFVAQSIRRELHFLLTLPPERGLHAVFARRLRDMCGLGLAAFQDWVVVVNDDCSIGLDDVGSPFRPDLRDLAQLTSELDEALSHPAAPGFYLADDLTWIKHLAHLHLVRTELASASG